MAVVNSIMVYIWYICIHAYIWFIYGLYMVYIWFIYGLYIYMINMINMVFNNLVYVYKRM